MTIAPDVTFQSTDLARRSRDVLVAARSTSGALIRDKDGESLLVEPAGRVARRGYELEGLRRAVRLLGVLRLPTEQRDPVLLGEFAWVSVLPEADQPQFVWEYVRALEAVSGTGFDAVEQLVYEWQQTARAWANEDLRGELTAPLNAPLHDVEL
jgi:hypothetical protein